MMGSEARHSWVAVWMVVFLSVGMARHGETSASSPIMNLYRGEINGKFFADMPLATITALLGDAAAGADTTGPVEALGVPRHYPPLGLSFWFAAPASDALQRCWMVVVHLAPQGEAHGARSCIPFLGASPNR